MLAESSSSSSWAPTRQSHQLSISCHISLRPDIPPLPGARGGREVICCEINCSLCHVSTARMASVLIGSTEKRSLWTVFHHGYNSCMETAHFQLLTQKNPVSLNRCAKSPNLLPNSINSCLMLLGNNNPKKEITWAWLLLNTPKSIQEIIGCHCLSFPRPPDSLHNSHLQFMLWIQNCFMFTPPKLPQQRDPSLLIPLFCLGPTFLAALGDKWELFCQVGFLWDQYFSSSQHCHTSISPSKKEMPGMHSQEGKQSWTAPLGTQNTFSWA